MQCKFRYATSSDCTDMIAGMPANQVMLRRTLCDNPQLMRRISLFATGLADTNTDCYVVVGKDNLGNGMLRCGNDLETLKNDNRIEVWYGMLRCQHHSAADMILKHSSCCWYCGGGGGGAAVVVCMTALWTFTISFCTSRPSGCCSNCAQPLWDDHSWQSSNSWVMGRLPRRPWSCGPCRPMTTAEGYAPGLGAHTADRDLSAHMTLHADHGAHDSAPPG